MEGLKHQAGESLVYTLWVLKSVLEQEGKMIKLAFVED